MFLKKIVFIILVAPLTNSLASDLGEQKVKLVERDSVLLGAIKIVGAESAYFAFAPANIDAESLLSRKKRMAEAAYHELSAINIGKDAFLLGKREEAKKLFNEISLSSNSDTVTTLIHQMIQNTSECLRYLSDLGK